MTTSHGTARTTGERPEPIRRTARNSASESDNKIHSDAEAQLFGYRAALVPGVTLYAYLTQLALPFFGEEWLARGGSSVRLLRPVYEGETVVCRAEPRADGSRTVLDLSCGREDGTVCAEGGAWLPDAPAGSLGGASSLPDSSPAHPLPELTPDTVPVGVPLAPLETFFDAEAARAYADETDDPSPLYRDASVSGGPVLPPGVLAGRQARLLRINFSFGPSIHVASEIEHLAPARTGALYRTGGVIRETYERKGNHYLVLDALTTAGGTPVMRVRHTTIFQVRRP